MPNQQSENDGAQPAQADKSAGIKILPIITIIIVVIIMVGGIVFLANRSQTTNSNTNTESAQTAEKNKYAEFIAETYDVIQKNFWDVLIDENLFKLYKLGTEKIKEEMPEIQIPETIASEDKGGLKEMVTYIVNNLEDDQKKYYSERLAAIVINNLTPFSRSKLYTTRGQQELTNRVYNIDPAANLYDALGVSASASAKEITQTIEQQNKELNQLIEDESQTAEAKEEAQQKLALVNRAQETLLNPDDRLKYDEQGIESTVYANFIGSTILHLKIKQLSPLTFDDFQKEMNKIDEEANNSLDKLILDFRGNVGGSFDILPNFLGLFIGSNQYAYEWYQQGQYAPFKTTANKLNSLARYKEIVILADQDTQSSAEVMIFTLKKYNIGTLVGTTTKGWGTIEKVFPLENQITPDETYSILLVHHVTIGDNSQPIESHGIEPMVNMASEDWQAQLAEYIDVSSLKNAVKDIWFEE